MGDTVPMIEKHAEFLNLQQSFDKMKGRVVDWYQLLVESVDEIETKYISSMVDKEKHFNAEIDIFRNKCFDAEQEIDRLQNRLNENEMLLTNVRGENAKIRNESIAEFSRFEEIANNKVDELERCYNERISEQKILLVQKENELKKMNEKHEEKMKVYNTSYLELIEKMKRVNEENQKKKEEYKKMLKEKDQKILEKLEIMNSVKSRLDAIQKEYKIQKEFWEKEKLENKEENVRMRTEYKKEIEYQNNAKMNTIKRLNVEMDRLRTIIQRMERENSELRKCSAIGNWLYFSNK